MKADVAATGYPGESATAEEVKRLADEYRQAAQHLARFGRNGYPLSHAPYRLLAIQAIELYLNALLLDSGHSPTVIRGMQHSLAKRIDLTVPSSLKLRKRTTEHLKDIDGKREYLVSRYDPEITTASQISRLTATLEEVGKKVTTWLEHSAARRLND